MRIGTGIFAALAALAAVAALGALAVSASNDEQPVEREGRSGEPMIEVISPRNGARQSDHAVVVKVRVRNFRLAPERFDSEPRLREGHLRFGLNRVPDCVDPVKLKRAEESPLGRGRLVGNSFDFPRYSGPNGILAAQIGSTGSYSPATRPEIFYRDLPTGFYRLVVTLARNDGSTTPYHAVTNFEILPGPGKGPKVCRGGKVSSAKADAFK